MVEARQGGSELDFADAEQFVWTGARIACFLTYSVRRGLLMIAAPSTQLIAR
jgi:hypothetical protein